LIVEDADGHALARDRTFEVLADWDRDGMADAYEEAEGLEPSLADDARWDRDGDGLSNFEEAWRGLRAGSPDSDGDGVDDGTEVKEGFDPLDPDSHPLASPPVLEVTRTPEAVVVSWPLGHGSSWRLESSPHLTPPSRWNEIPPPYPSGDAHHQVMVPPTEDTQFYRLRRP
jgi:hypothetical protein